MSHIDILGPEHFAEAVKAEGVVLVDFWAEWCGPCRMLGPVLHQIVDQYAGKVTLLKIDVDQEANQALAMQFGVSSIPQVTIFVGWQKVDQFVGVQSPEAVAQIVEKHLGEVVSAAADNTEETSSDEETDMPMAA